MNEIDLSALSNEPKMRQIRKPLDLGEILAAFRGSFEQNLRIMRDFYDLKSFEINPSKDSQLYLQIDGEPRSLFLPTDKGIGMKAFFDQCWDPRKVKFFQLIALNLERDVTLVDVGANVGLFTRQCVSELSSRGAAFCYEPNALNFNLLERNLGGVEGVRLINRGLSSVDGEMTLYQDPENTGGHTLNQGAAGENHEASSVEIVDAAKEQKHWIATGNRIFYKSDAESHDEKIATTYSDDFWDHVEAGTIELRRVGGKDIDHERFTRVLEVFPNKVFESKPNVNLAAGDILEFARGTDNGHDDLFFWR